MLRQNPNTPLPVFSLSRPLLSLSLSLSLSLFLSLAPPFQSLILIIVTYMYWLPVHFIPLKENARFFQFPIISQCQHFILSFFLSFILSFFHFFKSYHGDRAKSRDVVCIKWFFLKKTALWDLLWLLSLIWLFFLSLTDHVYRKSSLNAIYFDTFWEYNSALKKAALMGLRLIIKSRHFLFSFYPLFVLRSIPHRSRSLLLS